MITKEIRLAGTNISKIRNVIKYRNIGKLINVLRWLHSLVDCCELEAFLGNLETVNFVFSEASHGSVIGRMFAPDTANNSSSRILFWSYMYATKRKYTTAVYYK